LGPLECASTSLRPAERCRSTNGPPRSSLASARSFRMRGRCAIRHVELEAHLRDDGAEYWITFPSAAIATTIGLRKCFSSVNLLPVALSLAEINQPVSISYSVDHRDVTYPHSPISPSFDDELSLYINNRSVPYPVIPVLSTWGPSAAAGNPFVPAPTADRGPYKYTPVSCRSTNSSLKLGKALLAAKPSFPRPDKGFQPHHIKPVCFSGLDVAANGIWLPTNAENYPNYHQAYNTWFDPDNFDP